MTDPDAAGSRTGLGWPDTASYDPDGPGPLAAPDPTEVVASRDVSRETNGGGWASPDRRPAGLGWPSEPTEAGPGGPA